MEKNHGALIILFYVSLSSPPLQSRIKENAKILSKDLTTQENITTLRQNLIFLLKANKSNHPSASDWWENTKYSFEKNAITLSKNPTNQENIRVSRLKED